MGKIRGRPDVDVDRRERQRESARKFFKTLSPRDIGELGDQLVLGAFDWREWFHDKPSSAFMNELDYQRILWEEEHP